MSRQNPSNPKRTAKLIWLIALAAVFSASCSRQPERKTTPRPQTARGGSQTLTGRVVRIADGDTITVLDSSDTQHRIRLEGIDAPESHQAFGTQSKKNLSEMVFGKDVTIVYQKTDQYGRLVGKMGTSSSGLDVAQAFRDLSARGVDTLFVYSDEDAGLDEFEMRLGRNGRKLAGCEGIAFELIAFPAVFLFAFAALVAGMHGRPRWLLAAGPLFALCFYTYGPAKLFVPLFLLGAVVVYARRLMAVRRWAALGLLLAALTAAPVVAFDVAHRDRSG